MWNRRKPGGGKIRSTCYGKGAVKEKSPSPCEGGFQLNSITTKRPIAKKGGKGGPEKR